jgi:predicted small lipoprotein YifL
MSRRIVFVVLLILLAAVSVGCGSKGALVMPDQQATGKKKSSKPKPLPAPVPAQPAPVQPAPAQPTSDDSTGHSG